MMANRLAMAAALALLVLSADLAMANTHLVWTIPQADFERFPEALRQIENDLRRRGEMAGAPGPFRIHRMFGWFPEH